MTAHSKHDEPSSHDQERATGIAGTVRPDDVARRAYELFQERGSEPGRELDDWLRAERELKTSEHRNQSARDAGVIAVARDPDHD